MSLTTWIFLKQKQIFIKFQLFLNGDSKQEIIARCCNKSNNKQTSSQKIVGKSYFYAKKCFWDFREPDRGNVRKEDREMYIR